MNKTAQAHRTAVAIPLETAADPTAGHRALVKRIVASSTFSRSERLSSLLVYLCEMTLQGKEATLNEQKIGHAVFGRAPYYDSSNDGIVRTQASRLRQRLDQYFTQEGAEEPTQISIPRGRYVPQFLPRLAPDEPKLEIASEPLVAIAPVAPTASFADVARVPARLPWILCACLACLVAFLLLRGRQDANPDARRITSHPLWSRIFAPQQPTLVVAADSGLVLSHALLPRNTPLAEYLSTDFRTEAHGAELSAQMQALRTDFVGRRYTSVVDLEASVTLAQMARSADSALQVRYARDLRPNDLKSGNLIFLGAAEANPWVELFEKEMTFYLEDNYKTRIFSVKNRAPLPGEPTSWDSAVNDPQKHVYGVVAFVPNLSGKASALLVEGTSMAGTEAAWDFVSDDTKLLPFLRRIQRPNGEIPHFELVLGTQNVSSSAVHSELLAWRLHD